MVSGGIPKNQVARELRLSSSFVYSHTGDIIIRDTDKSRISGRTLKLLKDLLKNGYAFRSKLYGTCEFRKLRKHFPSIYIAKRSGRVIYYLEDKSDNAIKAFLQISRKNIISYQELNDIIKMFNGNLTKTEKKQFIS